MSSTTAELEGTQVTVEEVRQQNAKILQLIDISKLLPALKDKDILSDEIIKKVSDSKHHTQFERANFLLNYFYQKGQPAIDAFIAALREAETPNHAEVLRLLEGDLVDTSQFSPLFTILETQQSAIIKRANLTTLLKSLLTLQAIPLSTFLDLQNADRTSEETMERLLPMLEKQGSRGFINFLAALQKDLPNADHEKLSDILFAEVHKFFKDHPERERVSQSDKIELLQLERREKVLGQEVHQRIARHRDTLVAQINMAALLPSLLKHQVISRQDSDYLSQNGEQTDTLLDLILGKELGFMIKFAECLKESPVNREVGELLLPSPQTSKTVTPPKKLTQAGTEKFERVAVFVAADFYLARNGIPSSLEPTEFDKPIKEHKETLQRQLESLDFRIIDFSTNIDNESYPRDGKEKRDYRSKVITDRFKAKVASQCMEGAIVFLFLSGIQFPMKMDDYEYSGAVLRANASRFGRLPLDSIECKDLLEWVQEMPGSHVTIVVDTEPSHTVTYNKIREVSQVEIMESPWSTLVGPQSRTVVLYLQPDPSAMAASRGQGGRGSLSPLGMLTDTLTKAIVSCVLKNKDELVSHRSLYEAVSFYWHCTGESGRLHPLYIPAIAGDIDRCFLEKSSLPHQLTFRGDLTRAIKGQDMFSNSIKLCTGTMAGLIQGDLIEIYHVLRPGVCVCGRVSESFHLHSVAKIDDSDWPRLLHSLTELYKEGELGMAVGGASLEFVQVRKKFPLHQCLAVYPLELSRGDTNALKTYVKERSHLLSYVPQETNADVVVSQVEGVYHVTDKKKDIRYPMNTSSMEQVKSFLEIIAQFKYVLGLKPRVKAPPTTYECSLTAARPILSSAVPFCQEFDILLSSCVSSSPLSLGYEAILRFTDPPQYWTPVEKDPTPQLTVTFKRNKIISAIEFRGNPSYRSFVKKATLLYRTILLERKALPSDLTVDLADADSANLIVLQLGVKPGTNFSITFKLRVKKPKTTSGYVEQVWVHEPWPVPPAWSLMPVVDSKGCIKLNSHQLTWRGRGKGELALNLGGVPTTLDKMELVAVEGVEELGVTLISNQFSMSTGVFTSAFPKKYTFPRPIIASSITVQPVEYEKKDPNDMRPLGPSPLQLQLHGNTHGEPLIVDDGGLLNFQFNALKPNQQLYFYIVCLEETGAITIANCNEGEEKAKLVYEFEEGKCVFLSSKLFVQANIPPGYTPAAGHICDEYKVWVSPTRLCVKPFLQRGIHNQYQPLSFNILSHERREGVVTDEWFNHQYTVKVNKS